MTEITGINYCITHGGLLIDGLTDDECTYEEEDKADNDAPCVAHCLFVGGPA